MTWDDPYPGNENLYYADLMDVETGRRLDRADIVPAGTNSWSTTGSEFGNVQLGREYLVYIGLRGIPHTEASILVTTPDLPPSSRAAARAVAQAQALSPFLPSWPVSIGSAFDYVDDPFTNRGNGFHIGLDIGADDPIDDYARANSLRGSEVKAAEQGMLILFNDELEGNHVKYCPGLSDSFLQQLKISPGGEEVGCVLLVTANSGRTILILHETFRGKFITKYAHLKQGSIPAKFQSAKSAGEAIAVRRGEKIGELGSSIVYPTGLDEATDPVAFELLRAKRGTTGCTGEIRVIDPAADEARNERYFGWCALENGFPDAHLHFEIRKVDDDSGDLTAVWKTTARDCGDDVAPGRPNSGGPSTDELMVEAGLDCGWSERRRIDTVEDVEKRLPPLPASTVPRDPGGFYDAEVRDVRDNNVGRRVFEVVAANVANGHLTARISIAFWRPLFYSRYNVQPPRTQTSGIRGTAAGVTGYGTDIVAAPDHSDAACRGGRFQAAPVATDATTEGELPRETREVNLSAANSVCLLYVLTTNASYPAPEVSIVPNPPDSYRKQINIPDPIATFIYGGRLISGSRDVSGSLSGIQFRIYEVDVYADLTYEFCTTQVSGACVDEAAGAGTVLELWQEANRLGSSVASNLSWTADSGGTVFMVVRGDYASGAAAPNAGPYTLYYDIPPPNTCGPYGTSGARAASDTDSATTCVPQIPVLERVESTSNSITVRWNNVSPVLSPDAVRYELRIDGGTAQDPNSPDGMGTRSHRFGTLTPNTPYEIQIQAVLGTVESGWSVSQTVYTLPTTPAVPPAPAGLRVTEVTDTGARLHWGDVTGATGYKTRRDGLTSTLQTLGDVNEYPFTDLTPRRAHVLEVAASNSHGDSAFAGLTLLVPPTLNTPTATANSITLTWTALAGLTYEVKLGAGSAESARNPSSHTFSPPPSDTPHTLYVRARNAQGPSAWASTPATTAPTPTTNGLSLTASPKPRSCETNGTVTVNWTVTGGTEPYTVTVDGQSQSGSSATVDCQSTAGTQSVVVAVTDSSSPVQHDLVTLSLRVSDAPPVCSSPDTTQTDTTTESRWVGSGAVEDEQERTKSQQQTRTAQCNAGVWAYGPWTNVGSPTYSAWAATGNQRCNPSYPPKPSESKTETVTVTWWVLRGTAAHERDRTDTEHYSRTVTRQGLPLCGWNVSDWGQPDRTVQGNPSDTGVIQAKPADEQTRSAGTGTATQWIVGSTQACEQVEQLEQRRTRSVTFSSSSGWNAGTWSRWSDPYRSGWGNTGTCLAKPADYVVSVPLLTLPPITTTETRWVDVYVPPFFDCASHEERRTKSTRFTTHVTYSWGGSSWVSSSSTTEMSTYSAWARTGATGACSSSSQRSASSGTALLTAGDYELAWETQRLVFTVPAGATVELSGRSLDGGGHAAVLSVKGGAELVVTAEALSGTDEQRTARFAATTDPTLSAIAASLRAPAPAEAEPSVTTTTECPVAQRPESGATAVDLDADSCIVVRGGGAVAVALGEASLAITLGAGARMADPRRDRQRRGRDARGHLRRRRERRLHHSRRHYRRRAGAAHPGGQP